MTSKVLPEVRMWAVVVAATIVLVGCAGKIGQISLQVPTPSPFPGSPGSPRLAVRPLRDVRDLALLKLREGWFLEYLPDEALEPRASQAVTQALVERLLASGRFEQVLRLESDGEVVEPAILPHNPVPAELILEGDLQIFYVERSTVNNAFLSMLTAPLGMPLTALSGMKLLPSPVTPFLPVNYRANLTMQIRLCDSLTGTVVWERTVEGIGEISKTVAADLFKSKETLMKETATLALRAAIEKFARQLPPADWLKARWPKSRMPGPGVPAPIPR